VAECRMWGSIGNFSLSALLWCDSHSPPRWRRRLLQCIALGTTRPTFSALGTKTFRYSKMRHNQKSASGLMARTVPQEFPAAPRSLPPKPRLCAVGCGSCPLGQHTMMPYCAFGSRDRTNGIGRRRRTSLALSSLPRCGMSTINSNNPATREARQ